MFNRYLMPCGFRGRIFSGSLRRSAACVALGLSISILPGVRADDAPASAETEPVIVPAAPVIVPAETAVEEEASTATPAVPASDAGVPASDVGVTVPAPAPWVILIQCSKSTGAVVQIASQADGTATPAASAPAPTPAPADQAVPLPTAPAAPVAAAPMNSAPVITPWCPPMPRMSYREAYAEVPFNRAEYEANPSYRHEAAMELMFGQLRPTTIVKHNIHYFSRYPDFIRNRYQTYPYLPGGSNTMNLNHYWHMRWYW